MSDELVHRHIEVSTHANICRLKHPSSAVKGRHDVLERVSAGKKTVSQPSLAKMDHTLSAFKRACQDLRESLQRRHGTEPGWDTANIADNAVPYGMQ